ncbi:uncharacterized protein LOC132619904 [Lycium barbarum]|uniref:uncharacterized protein LOC132619904 n=1 Tax=Lycium barbarum TaxID=112863 RepID=UPI00293EAD8B|nr:uncharacterized protein LOC132619904 [Lycium barbarum]
MVVLKCVRYSLMKFETAYSFLCKNCGRLGHLQSACPYPSQTTRPRNDTASQPSEQPRDLSSNIPATSEWQTVSFANKRKGSPKSRDPRAATAPDQGQTSSQKQKTDQGQTSSQQQNTGQPGINVKIFSADSGKFLSTQKLSFNSINSPASSSHAQGPKDKVKIHHKRFSRSNSSTTISQSRTNPQANSSHFNTTHSLENNKKRKGVDNTIHYSNQFAILPDLDDNSSALSLSTDMHQHGPETKKPSSHSTHPSIQPRVPNNGHVPPVQNVSHPDENNTIPSNLHGHVFTPRADVENPSNLLPTRCTQMATPTGQMSDANGQVDIPMQIDSQNLTDNMLSYSIPLNLTNVLPSISQAQDLQSFALTPHSSSSLAIPISINNGETDSPIRSAEPSTTIYLPIPTTPLGHEQPLSVATIGGTPPADFCDLTCLPPTSTPVMGRASTPRKSSVLYPEHQRSQYNDHNPKPELFSTNNNGRDASSDGKLYESPMVEQCPRPTSSSNSTRLLPKPSQPLESPPPPPPHFNPPVNMNPILELPFYTPPELITANTLLFPWQPIPIPPHAPPIRFPMAPPPPSAPMHPPIVIPTPSLQPTEQIQSTEEVQDTLMGSFTEIATLRMSALMIFPEKEEKKYIHVCPVALTKCSLDLRPTVNKEIAKYAVVLTPTLRSSPFATRDTTVTANPKYTHTSMSNPSSIIVWNIRGGNNPVFKRNFRELIQSHNPCLVVLLETRMTNHSNFRNDYGFDDFLEVPAQGQAGGIVLLWNTTVVTVTELRKSA